jgi:type II secretory pathway pseudopilin PulG
MKKKIKIPQKFQLGMRGVSLVEVLVAAAMIAGLAITLATIQQRAAEANRAAALQQTAQDLKARMLQALADQRAWDATINAAANSNAASGTSTEPLQCVRHQLNCYATSAAAPFTIYDSAGAILFANVATGAGGSQRGFNARGEVCNTFNETAATGDSTCVFATQVSRTFICPSTTCINPQINISITLMYRPLNNKPLASLDMAKYSVSNFVRGAKALTKSFSVSHQVTTTSGSGGVGGGNCDGANGTVNRLWTTETDPFDMVTVDTSITGTGVVAFNSSTGIGTFKCRASATFFGVGAYTINLKKGSTIVGTTSGIARAATSWLQSTASLDTIFTTSIGESIFLEQVCENPNWGVGGWQGAQQFAQGVGVSPYGLTTFATLICSRLD